MSSVLFSKGVLDALDRHRRAFLWTDDDKCTGANYLVAWDDVCVAKLEGGLGVKDLETPNRCLLMKFIHKIHQAKPLPWKNWFLPELHGDLGASSNDSTFLGNIISSELSRYRVLTKVCIGNGRATSFWLDDWHDLGPLFTAFPTLFSHTIHPHAPVLEVMLVSPWSLSLRARLTHAARAELLRMCNSRNTLISTIWHGALVWRLPSVPQLPTPCFITATWWTLMPKLSEELEFPQKYSSSLGSCVATVLTRGLISFIRISFNHTECIVSAVPLRMKRRNISSSTIRLLKIFGGRSKSKSKICPLIHHGMQLLHHTFPMPSGWTSSSSSSGAFGWPKTTLFYVQQPMMWPPCFTPWSSTPSGES